MTGQLVISFTANYAGLHRICYGIQGEAQTCVNVNCPIGPYTYTVDVEVDPQACENTVFEGTVRALCSGVEHPFEVTFTPDPYCLPWTLTCLNAEGCAQTAMMTCFGLVTIPAAEFERTFEICSHIEPAVPPGYRIDPSALCCSDCVEVTFTCTGGDVAYINYLRCDVTPPIASQIAVYVNDPQTVCAIRDMWFSPFNNSYSAVVNGPCNPV